MASRAGEKGAHAPASRERLQIKVTKLYNAREEKEEESTATGGGVPARAAFPLGRRFLLCLAFLSAPHFLDAAILSSSAGRGNKGAAAMSEAGILWLRLSHMAESAGVGHPTGHGRPRKSPFLSPGISGDP